MAQTGIFEEYIIKDVLASRPAATAVTPGTLYGDEDGIIYRSDGTTWEIYTNPTSGTSGVTSVTGTSPIASSGGATPAISLNDTAVTPGSYTNANITVDAKGRLTAAANGTGGGGGSSTLAGDTDVNIATPANNDTLQYQTSDNKWHNVAPASARTNLGLGTLATQSGTFSGTSSGTNTGDQTLSDATISTTDITTNNVSTTKHGFTPKAPNDTTKFLRGDATWAAPTGGYTDPLTTKGDIPAYSTATGRLPVGTNGQVIVADSTATFGLRYESRYVEASFTADGAVYLTLPYAVTLDSPATHPGTATLAYAKSSNATPTTFSAVGSWPATFAAGDTLRVTASGVSTWETVRLTRTA